MKDRWIKHFFEQAQHKAEMSKDENTKVGAVIVSEEDMVEVSSGFNCLPRGVAHTKERNARPLKYHFTSHAEASAIANSARLGRATKGTTLITTMFPCNDCCCLIINAGIAKVVSPAPDFNHYKYGKLYQYSMDMLKEAGVIVSLEEND